MTRLERNVNLAAVLIPPVGIAISVPILWGSALHLSDVLIWVVLYFLTGFGITIGYHRLLTHRAFATHRGIERGLAVAGALALQGSPSDWVADHRKHHAHADSDGDPHSPHAGQGAGVSGALRGLWHAHVGWLWRTQGQADGRKYARELYEDPFMRGLHRHYHWLALGTLALPFLLGLAVTGTWAGALTALVWGGLVRVFLIHHITWSVNSICHFFGRRRFSLEDHSTNVALAGAALAGRSLAPQPPCLCPLRLPRTQALRGAARPFRLDHPLHAPNRSGLERDRDNPGSPSRPRTNASPGPGRPPQGGRMTTCDPPVAGEVLITGATGFLGIEVLARYLEQDTRNVIVLVRAEDDEAAQQRIDDTLLGAFGPASAADYRQRIEAVAADVARPNFGLPLGRLRELAERTEVVVHSAASVSFALPLSEAREVNVGGTSEMLAFARTAMELGGLARYVHISTAYVSGTHQGVFSEQDLYVGQGFRNSYEQSKCEAELLVRAAHHLPVTILRPSIIVGDRRTGWTAAFNVIYWPLRALAKSLLTAVPALPSSPVDVVSVDYVADAIHALAEHPAAVGHTYHLTAGPATSSIGEIATLASDYFGRPGPDLIPPVEFELGATDSKRERVFAEASTYFPYFSVETILDNTDTRALLDPLGIQAAPLSEYLDRLLDFATSSRWGKARITRAEAQEAALAYS